MLYKATVFYPNGEEFRIFRTFEEAAYWLDSVNNNVELKTIIDLMQDDVSVDGYVYTEKSKGGI